MKRKHRSVKNAPIEVLMFDMLCDGIAEGDHRSEQLLVSMNPDQGHAIAAHIRHLVNGPKALLPARVSGGWSFIGSYAGPRLTLCTRTPDNAVIGRRGELIIL